MSAVIFDLDGTLVESAPAIRDIVNRLMDEIGLARLDVAEVRSYVGNGAAVLLERALAARDASCTGERFAGHLERLLVFFDEAPAAANAPMPGVDDALRSLHAAGVRLGVCTNKPEAPTRQVLEVHGWDKLFGAVVAGDTLAQRKPDPAPLHEVARRLAAQPVFYVGDSDVDAATAAAAEIPFLLYTEGYRKAAIEALPHTVAFADFGALPGLLETLKNSARS